MGMVLLECAAAVERGGESAEIDSPGCAEEESRDNLMAVVVLRQKHCHLSRNVCKIRVG